VFTFPDRYEGARVSDVVTVKICEAIAVPVGEKTITRPVVAPVGMFTVIVVEVLVKVVVDFAPNCTFVALEKPVPVMTTSIPTAPVNRDKAVIFGAAPESPELVDTGASTCKQLPTPTPVGLLGTVPAGHVIV
jgi:hypothetical protein